MAPLLNTRGHKFKLYKKRCSAIVRSKFFSERIVNRLHGIICQAASTLVRLAVLFALSNLLIYLIT